MRDLAKDYRAKKLVSLAHSTQVSYGRHLKRVEKKLGALTVREIEASDVVALIEGAGLTWGESNMLLITTKCLFTHACGKRLINANPCHGIMLSALLGERPPRRQRLMLTREELKLLLAAPMRPRNALAIRILLATAVRSAELYQAQWADVDPDGAQWHIPKSKTGAAMDIPLAPVVVDWFRELRTLAGNSAYVLPAHSRSRAARHGGDTHLNKDTLREAIAHWLRTAKPAVRRFTPHDLRSTVKSHVRALGVPRDISEMCLNHRLSGVEGIYDRHTYFEERREALERWAGVLPFEAVVSVPCFELWLLLHFEDVFAPLHRDEAMVRLRGYLAGYAKGQGSHWAVTRERLDVATARANALLAAGHTADAGAQPYTNMHELVHRLLHLKDQAA